MVRQKMKISHERLKEMLVYDPETGIFTWRIRVSYSVLAGMVAGFVHPSGYRVIRIQRRTYKASRLAWFYVNGAWPNPSVDHRNRIKLDDRIGNLREATQAQQSSNIGVSKRNKCGIKGVFWLACDRVWIAAIQRNKIKRRLGRFQTKEEAAAAYRAAVAEADGEFACVG